jgi:hypothetical protein
LRFPDNKQITASYSIVGGFIFLRFFCSAIFSPFGFGVAGTHGTARHDTTRHDTTRHDTTHA